MSQFALPHPRAFGSRLFLIVALVALPLAGLTSSSGQPLPPTPHRMSATPPSAGGLPTSYSVTKIAVAYPFVPSLNNYGQVVAEGNIENGDRVAHLWTPTQANGTAGNITRIVPPHLMSARWLKFNDYGQFIYGANVNAENATYVDLWTPTTLHGSSGGWTQFGGAEEAAWGDALDLNAAGEILSTHSLGGDLFVWRPGQPNGTSGSLLELGYSGSGAMNDLGEVCVNANAINPISLVVGTRPNLQPAVTLPGYGAIEINNAGEICTFNDALYRRTGGGQYESISAPWARRINSRGDLCEGGFGTRVWLKDAGGEYVENPAIADALERAGIHSSYYLEDINDQGQIVGRGGTDEVPTGLIFLLSPRQSKELQLFDANIDYSAGMEFPSPASQSMEGATGTYFNQHAKQRAKIAADGVTLLLLRMKLPVGTTGTARFRIEEDPVVNAELGSLWAVNSSAVLDDTEMGDARHTSGVGVTQLDVPLQVINGVPWAFALYRSPRNFDPDESTGSFVSRDLLIRGGIAGEPLEDTVTTPLSVLRPLVILQHGTFSGLATWSKLPKWILPEDGFTLWLQGMQDIHGFEHVEEQGSPVPFAVTRTTFEGHRAAAGPIQENAWRILEQVIDRMDRWREVLNAAGTQADVITHSYGGPVMRQASQMEDVNEQTHVVNHLTLSTLSFRRKQNWGHGYFHKLLTIAGSHRGSAMTNQGARLNKFGKVEGGWAKIANHVAGTRTYEGAMRDQFVMSPALQALREATYPCHAFVGSGMVQGTDTLLRTMEAVPFIGAYDVDKRGGPFQKAGTPYSLPTLVPPLPPLPLFDNLKKSTNWHFNLSYTKSSGPEGDPNYDLTVSSRSASAGLAKPFYSDITDLNRSDLSGKVTHLQQTNNRLVSERMIFLLHQKTTSRYFTHFPPGSGVGAKPLDATEKKLSNRADYNPYWLLLGTSRDPAAAAATFSAQSLPTLTANVAGPDICPGDHLTFTLAWSGKSIARALLTWPSDGALRGMGVLGGNLLSQEVTVADLDPGRFEVGALVTATDGTSETVSLTLEVCDPNTYSELRTDPTELRLRDTSPHTLLVYGKLPNQDWAFLSNSLYTTLVSADPQIARVNAEGEIVPVKFGSTTVHVSHRGVGRDVPVIVDGTPVSVTAVLAGRNPTIDSRSTKTVDFAFLSSTGFDARTINPETVLVGGKAPVVATNGAIATTKDVNKDGKLDLVVKQIPAYLHLSPGPVQIRLLAVTSSGTLVGGDAAATAR